MASTPEDPSEPEENKLELPRLGGLLRRRKKGAEAEDAPEHEAADETLAPVDAEVGETQPLRVEELAEQPEDTDVAHIDWDDEPTTERAIDHGPELVAPDTAYAEEEPEEPIRKRRRPSLPSRPSAPELSLPLLDDRIAVVVTGVVVGLTGVLLTYLFQLGCGAVRGAGSCGTAGLLLLLAVLIVMVFEGAALLRAWFLDEPLTTSFLAVALLAVVSMLVLLPIIDRWFMVIVIPVLTAGLFWLSWFVTSRFDAPEREAQRERENAN